MLTYYLLKPQNRARISQCNAINATLLNSFPTAKEGVTFPVHVKFLCHSCSESGPENKKKNWFQHTTFGIFFCGLRPQISGKAVKSFT